MRRSRSSFSSDNNEERNAKLARGVEASRSSTDSTNTSNPTAAAPASPTHIFRKLSRDFVGCSKKSDYTLEDKLGEGTFGEVHKARDRRTGQLVALKRILMHDEKEMGFPITAIREIKILKQLKHKNIVTLTDIVVDYGDTLRRERGIYMVFPYMDHDLAGLLGNPSVRLEASHIKTYMKQLLEGTAYLHHNKILHRDMKAANLLINNHGILQIADFGLARGIENDKEKQYTQCVVTRWYRPPELFFGERHYTSAIDMWGVGCVFGEFLTKRPILSGHSDLDQVKKIFQLCGSPTEETMPGWSKLPDASKYKFEPSKRRVLKHFSEYGDEAADLMDKLLQIDANKRLTALDALEHDYFYTKPLPADPKDLPWYEASHEYNRRRAKKSDNHSNHQNHNHGPNNTNHGHHHHSHDNAGYGKHYRNASRV